MKKVKVKGEDVNVSEEAYALIDAIKDLTYAIKRWKRG